MTGFESWVRTGIKLGAEEVLKAAAAVLERKHVDKTPTPAELLALHAEVADELQDRWPPWKRERTNQATLALDQVDQDNEIIDRDELDKAGLEARECARCHIMTPRLRGTPYGKLCPRCLSLYLDRKWPENAQ